jgi:membrane protein DedA with SNARE-associated domain
MVNYELVSSISQHGYLAIFVLVFLQEVGFPSPIPNEFVLICSGYLAYLGVLNFPLIILSVFLGDILSSSILYIVFYFFGKIILQRKPKWIPISQKKMDSIALKINQKGSSGVFIGRLTPFIRGYVSVLCGLLQFSPKKFSFIIIGTGAIWSFTYVTIGVLIGPYWNYLTNSNQHIYLSIIMVTIFIIVIIFFVVKRLLVRSN